MYMAYSNYRGALYVLMGILWLTPVSSFALDYSTKEGFAALIAQAEKGDQHSQFLAGIIYLESGGRENSFQGATWCRKSALQGNRLGQYHLATCYESGNGVPKSLIEAYAFYNLVSPVDNSALWKRDGLVQRGILKLI
jgi:TPR repeat protein